MKHFDSFSLMNQVLITDQSTSNCSSLFQSQSIPPKRKGKSPLPVTFLPHAYSVLLGRGRVNEAVGNRRLKILVDMELRNYEKAPSRRDKGFVVARVMGKIHQAAVVGAFVRCEGGFWYEVTDSEAREKISTMFRDKLSHLYNSSTSKKVERRRQRKALKKRSVKDGDDGKQNFINMDFAGVQTELDSTSNNDKDASLSSSDSDAVSTIII